MNVLVTIGLWLLIFIALFFIELFGAVESRSVFLRVGKSAFEDKICEMNLLKLVLMIVVMLMGSGAWFAVEALGLSFIKALGFGALCIVGDIALGLGILEISCLTGKFEALAKFLFIILPNATAATLLIVCLTSAGLIK